MARIARLEGRVMWIRGGRGRWQGAIAGISLLAGDRVNTRSGTVRLELNGGATIFLNKNSVLRLRRAVTEAGEAALLELARGEAYVVDAGASPTYVETPEGLFSPVGTRFDVNRRTTTTVVTVEEGVVVARAKARASQPGRFTPVPESTPVDLRGRKWAGEPLRIAAGQQSHVRVGARPSAARPARRLRLNWIPPLAPELAFAGWPAGPLLYGMRDPHGKLVPGQGRGQTLEGWTYPLGRAWRIQTATKPRDAMDARRWAPVPLSANRSHSVVGQPAWRDYEVSLAFRVKPGSVQQQAHSVYAIVYQGAASRDLYRFSVWDMDGDRPHVGIVRHYGGRTRIYGMNPTSFQVRSGHWHRLRFAVRTFDDRIEMRGKVWPASQREPWAWTLESVDRSPDRLHAGYPGVGLHNLHAEFAEFAVHKRLRW